MVAGYEPPTTRMPPTLRIGTSPTGEPIHTEDYDEDAWQDAMLVFEMTDRIRDHIQQMLYRNLMGRRSAFF